MSVKMGLRTEITGGIASRGGEGESRGGGDPVSELELESMLIGGDGGQGSCGGIVRRPLSGSTMAIGKADLGMGAAMPVVEQASLVDVLLATTLRRGDGRVGV